MVSVMTDEEARECLRLMKAADEILMAKEQLIVAAYLSMAIETLRQHAGIEG